MNSTDDSQSHFIRGMRCRAMKPTGKPWKNSLGVLTVSEAFYHKGCKTTGMLCMMSDFDKLQFLWAEDGWSPRKLKALLKLDLLRDLCIKTGKCFFKGSNSRGKDMKLVGGEKSGSVNVREIGLSESFGIQRCYFKSFMNLCLCNY